MGLYKSWVCMHVVVVNEIMHYLVMKKIKQAHLLYPCIWNKAIKIKDKENLILKKVFVRSPNLAIIFVHRCRMIDMHFH